MHLAKTASALRFVFLLYYADLVLKKVCLCECDRKKGQSSYCSGGSSSSSSSSSSSNSCSSRNISIIIILVVSRRASLSGVSGYKQNCNNQSATSAKL